MIIKILIGVAIVVAILWIVVMVQPNSFRIWRSVTIGAPPEIVFAEVNDFHNWRAWSPWEKMDPDMQRKYEGPSSGAGAVYSWVGNKKVGEGRMTIVDSRPGELVKIKLEFFKPFKATNTAQFDFKPGAEGTAVTWAMSGERECFMFKLFGMFMNMDKMVGGDFERGLAAMKKVCESAAARELSAVN